ncbi:MAG: EF-P lysine aminoacylase GenX, partial [Candidatus Magasanikbacteria bacterium CG10_big_fil_rev_8_21_14_0_10_43_6]
NILAAIRAFFIETDFTEIETPALLTHAGQDPYLSPMALFIHDEHGTPYQAYLHTSPEYSMKKMLAAGYDRIFFLGKCFRDHESFGGLHNPEFTMLEFYETHSNMFGLMERVEELFQYVGKHVEEATGKRAILPVTRIHMRDLWQQTLGVDLDAYLTTSSLLQLCIDIGYAPGETESYEDLFYRIFLNKIEPALGDMGVVMIHHYPAQMASLAMLSEKDRRYAERVEVYAGGIELANGFTELTNGDQQRERFEAEQAMRRNLGKPVYPIDEDFIEAVDSLPNCAGIAIGVDRLVQMLLGCQNIDDVLVLPMSKQ